MERGRLREGYGEGGEMERQRDRVRDGERGGRDTDRHRERIRTLNRETEYVS